MNKLFFTLLVALGLVLPAGDVLAQQNKGKGKPDVEMREQREKSKEMRKVAEDRAEDERERAEERAEEEREEAEERAEEMREKERERAENEEGFGHDLDDDQMRSEGRGNEGRGNERAQEMRERRDERKRIQEEYREDRVNGQEGDAAREGDDDQKKEKKPWWKFWGD